MPEALYHFRGAFPVEGKQAQLQSCVQEYMTGAVCHVRHDCLSSYNANIALCIQGH